MKRFFSMLLALCLSVTLALPAWAANIARAVKTDTVEGTDLAGDLADITAQVKETLDIDDDYTNFSSDYADGVTPGWYLYWSDDDRDLSVTCREDGTITEVYSWQSTTENDRFYGFDPAFPAMTQDEAQRQAQTLLAKLMAEGQRARIDAVSTDLDDGTYSFSGTVMVNGLESPITFWLTLGESGLENYYRSDSYRGYVGDVPAAQTQTDKAPATEKLAQAVAFELYYVKNGDEARLTYVPVGANTVVDASTGEAVDMDGLYAALGESYGGYNAAYTAEAAAADTAADSGRGLTEVELASIANYGDVLDQSAIDEALQAIPALGLTGFSLQRCSYSMDADTGAVTASLRYSAAMTGDNLFGYSKSQFEEYSAWDDDMTVYKYITVDAKTGKLLSVSTSYPLYQRDSAYTISAAAQGATTEAFLSQVAPELFEKAALCTLGGYEDNCTYAQVENGYFYPDNYLYVSLNPAAATVDTYYYDWDEDVTFASIEGILTQEQALAAYTQALDVTLGYVAWPESVDADDAYAVYREWGYSYVESLRLGYYYSGLETVTGVDALTGDIQQSAYTSAGTYVYDDTADLAQAQQAEALAQAGIGFAGGQLQPDEILTQREAVTLLLQAAGYTTPETWEDDRLESMADYQGFVTGTWEPDAPVTELEFVRMLLGASRYGAAAQLTAAWAVTDEVAQADQGYVALALALGMVQPDALPGDTVCTHLTAVEMLYGFMSR
jgi:hypothetical protein